MIYHFTNISYPAPDVSHLLARKSGKYFLFLFKRITSLGGFPIYPPALPCCFFMGWGCCTSFVGGPRNPLHLILIPNLFTGAGPPFKSSLNIYVSPFSLPHECLSKHFTFSFWKLAEYIQVLPTLFLCMELYEAALGYNFTREYYAYCSEN